MREGQAGEMSDFPMVCSASQWPSQSWSRTPDSSPPYPRILGANLQRVLQIQEVVPPHAITAWLGNLSLSGEVWPDHTEESAKVSGAPALSITTNTVWLTISSRKKGQKGGTERESSLGSHKTLILSWGPYSQSPHLNLIVNTSQILHLQIFSLLELGLQCINMYNFWEKQCSSSSSTR